MSVSHPDYSVILAAGRGTRMGQTHCPKACFPVNGVPAISRAMRTYENCGIDKHLIIIGKGAGQLVETVGSEFSNVAYVYQKEQLGTANALRCLKSGLSFLPDDAELLIVAGDRLVDQTILERFFTEYFSKKADFAVLALKCAEKSGQGRIFCDNHGRPAAIIEMADIKQRKTYEILRKLAEKNQLPDKQNILQIIKENFFGSTEELSNEKKAKAAKAFAKIWQILDSDKKICSAEFLDLVSQEDTYFEFMLDEGKQALSPDEAKNLPYGNTSVYLLKYKVLKAALAKLDRDNAQQEEYLSDLPKIIYQNALLNNKKPNLFVHKSDDSNLILGFNNPAELLEVEEKLKLGAEKEKKLNLDTEYFRSYKEWQEFFSQLSEPDSKAKQIFQSIYGEDNEIISRQAVLFSSVLQEFSALPDFSEEDLIALIRMPGRLNVMGRHVDHQGGNCNLMTISFEAVMLVRAREDDLVRVKHCDAEQFSASEFSISELLAELPWEDWNSVISSEKLMQRFRNYGVDWSEYIKAAVLRLQKKFSSHPLFGMDLVVAGNVPMAAGLSSSSSLLVGAAEAAIAVNDLKTFPAQMVTLCGEGEWFVGTRGGNADHAAIKMGQQGSVVKVRFFNFAIEETVPFPQGYTMLVCDSGIKARKSSDAKDQFNHRISCYRIGFALIKKIFPQYAALLKHLRDVNMKNLQIPLSGIYRILLMLPEKASLAELQEMLPEISLQELCAEHKAPADGLYPIRGVVLFGLSEAERSAAYIDYLKAEKMEDIGRMMDISHDGDRVCSFSEDWQEVPFQSRVDNAYILERLADLESGIPELVVRSQLLWQAGAYACSLPEIDLMVDIAKRTEGVYGAQLAGAGLGGCMMVLCKTEAVEKLQNNLKKNYYDKKGIEAAMLLCKPVAGGGLLPFFTNKTSE